MDSRLDQLTAVQRMDAFLKFSNRPRAFGGPFLALLVLVVSLQSFSRRQFGESFSRLPGDLGDMRLVLYILEHGYQYLTGQQADYWDARFFYPHPNTMALSETQLGSLPFYTAVRLTGTDRETSFQYWILIGYGLNYAAAAFALRRLGIGWLGTTFGAYIFAFDLVQTIHLGHPQIVYRFPAPVAFVFFIEFLRTLRWFPLAISLFAFAFQCYISLYPGYFLALLLVSYAAAEVILGKAILRKYLSLPRKVWAAHGAVAVAALLSLTPLLIHYGDSTIKPNSKEEVLTLLPRPISYALGSKGEAVALNLLKTTDPESRYPPEHRLYIGAIPLLCLVLAVGLAFGRFPPDGLRECLVTILVLVALTLSIKEYSLYHVLLDLFPPLTGIRAVTRFIHILLVPIAILAAIVLQTLMKESPFDLSTDRKMLIAGVALAILVWENQVACPTVAKAEVQRSSLRVEAALRNTGRLQPDSILATLFVPGESTFPLAFEIDAMLASQSLGIATINGYSRVFPDGWRVLKNCADVVDTVKAYSKVAGLSVAEYAKRLVFYPPEINCQPFFETTRKIGNKSLPATAYSARVQIKVIPDKPKAAKPGSLLLSVTNTGTETWPCEFVGASARFVKPGETALQPFDNRLYFNIDFPPQRTYDFIMPVVFPAKPGKYIVPLLSKIADPPAVPVLKRSPLSPVVG